MLKNFSLLKPIFLILFVLLVFPSQEAQARKSKYHKKLKEWTRSDEIYKRKDLYATLSWNVTYQSDDFLEAKIHKIAKIYDYDAQKTQEVRQKEFDKFGKSVSFFVSFYGYERRFSDLSKKRNGWKLTLNVNGKQYEPTKYEKMTKVRPLYKVLYPYSNVWSYHYYVYFDIPPGFDSSDVQLSVHGPTGSSTLRW